MQSRLNSKGRGNRCKDDYYPCRDALGLLTISGLRLIQMLSAQAKVAQNSCQSSLRDVLASVAWDRGKRAILRIPPDFMRPWSLSNKLTTQLVKLFDQYAISHTGTRRSA